ncbi:hypothetical protein V8G54_028565 [Vigna mungo]|uniref:Uncharacterized protein n=1 Tax=Vigna mungo TaxID=3915 RepID=A0AAQ3MRN3_VIGMU
MEGRSNPLSDTHFSAVSANLVKLSGFIFPLMLGSMMSSSVPLLLLYNAHSARLTCSLGRLGLRAGLAQRASNSTTPNEYTSDFSVNCCLLKYSGSKYPKLPFTTVLI